MNILVIEDDPTLNKNIAEALQAEGFHVDGVFDGLLAERFLLKKDYQAIILDINLPGKNGYDVLAAFREKDEETPVLLLTAFGELEDKVKGFDLGADDYLTKPFYMRELVLRVQSLTKRKLSGMGRKNVLVFEDIRVDLGKKTVERQGKEVILTPREFQILVRLCQTPGELVSKAELIEEIWGTTLEVNTNTIEVYINFLRNKLDKPFHKQSIKTKVGYGYYLHED
jgi:two-component system OmpR family response regulator